LISSPTLGRTFDSEIKDTSIVAKSGVSAVTLMSVANIGPFHYHHPFIVPQPPGQLAIADVNGVNQPGAAPEGTVCKPPGRRAHVQDHPVLQVQAKDFMLSQVLAHPGSHKSGNCRDFNIRLRFYHHARFVSFFPVNKNQPAIMAALAFSLLG
jgi:hypothetical protein